MNKQVVTIHFVKDRVDAASLRLMLGVPRLLGMSRAEALQALAAINWHPAAGDRTADILEFKLLDPEE